MGTPFIDDEGHAFKVSNHPRSKQDPSLKFRRVRAKRARRRLLAHQHTGDVLAAQRVIIPPISSCKVPVRVFSPNEIKALYIERQFHSNGNADKIYGSPDTLLDTTTTTPFLHVSNFSTTPVVVPEGKLLGKSHNPRTWLDRHHQVSELQVTRQIRLIRALVHSNAIRSQADVSSKAQRNTAGLAEDAGEDPVEGGPKTAEVAVEEVSSTQLLDEIHISPDLTEEQRQQVERVVQENMDAFGLDGRLGNHPGLVDITLQPGAQLSS